MAATTTRTSLGRGGAAEDRVLATAQRIVKSLNTPKEVREDMLLIFSTFDNRLSNISDLIHQESTTMTARLEAGEKVILRWDTPGSDISRLPLPWEETPDEVVEYLAAVDELLQLTEDLSVMADEEMLDRAEAALQMAMSRLEDEFRLILTRNTVPLDAERLYGSIRRVSPSFTANEEEISEEFESYSQRDCEGGCFHERLGDDVFVDLINPSALGELKLIADRMIRSGYEKECVQVYSIVRREALEECMVILGVEKLSIEQVQKMEWWDLDEKMKKWIQAVTITVQVLLWEEKRLCDLTFDGSDSVREVCFNETAKGCVMRLLNFAEAVAIGKRSTEKLSRILDMYDSLADAMLRLQEMVSDDFVCSETKVVLDGLGEAAKGTFVEFENAVKNETSKKPMQNGEIHPLTRYVMNYVRLLADYSPTLNCLLDGGGGNEADGLQGEKFEGISPIASRLSLLISTLESNLEEKSKIYEDSGLQFVFLMNNILYIVLKVKDSELGRLLGDDWIRKRRTQVRQYATSYLRASWSKALSCLKDEGIGGSSNNASKVALKDRFKSFNACFEEIYRIQTAWKVPDPQLREELRISISEKVLPAYRSFLGRFGNQLEGRRHPEKYIKYTLEDLEGYLVDLFEGSPLMIHQLRRKSS